MLSWLYSPIGLLLQVACIVHFIRRRPDTFWLFIIIFGGVIGALAYFVMEILPELQSSHGGMDFLRERSRVRELENAVQTNPSAGNFEELGELYLHRRDYARARQAYDRAISSRTDHLDPFYRRGLASMALQDFQPAAADLERVVAKDAGYDFHRAAGLLAHALARTGQHARAAELFEQAAERTTVAEIQVYYGEFLAEQGRSAEAREVLQRMLKLRQTAPAFVRRRDRPWYRRASALLRRLPQQA